MQTKLTLRMDEKLVNQAKTVAKTQGKSVSQIVADYFVALSANEPQKVSKHLPVTRSLRGLMVNADVSREDYREHLAQKYQ
ncbi:MAG: DUF6364 family protein [Methylotenera sp.]|nr:DUF6364 family protein [Methylotenera sp.]